jgi:hypothetical protein
MSTGFCRMSGMVLGGQPGSPGFWLHVLRQLRYPCASGPLVPVAYAV